MKTNGKPRRRHHGEDNALTRITVKGFKSIARKQSIDFRPLTILAGVNSSGKSSMMQPLLLLKQTVDSTVDPGPLMLIGPNVKFTSVEQMLARTSKNVVAHGFYFEVESEQHSTIDFQYMWDAKKRLALRRQRYSDPMYQPISHLIFHTMS
jgi:predicted ATPase